MNATVGIAAIKAAIKSANGRRRERLLSVRDILLASIQLGEGEHKFLHGGHVSNSYGYRANATIAVVWRDSNGVWAIVQVGSATKGSTGFGQFRSWLPPEDRSNCVALPDIQAIAGMDTTAAPILADALCDMGLDELASEVR